MVFSLFTWTLPLGREPSNGTRRILQDPVPNRPSAGATEAADDGAGGAGWNARGHEAAGGALAGARKPRAPGRDRGARQRRPERAGSAPGQGARNRVRALRGSALLP